MLSIGKAAFLWKALFSKGKATLTPEEDSVVLREASGNYVFHMKNYAFSLNTTNSFEKATTYQETLFSKGNSMILLVVT